MPWLVGYSSLLDQTYYTSFGGRSDHDCCASTRTHTTLARDRMQKCFVARMATGMSRSLDLQGAICTPDFVETSWLLRLFLVSLTPPLSLSFDGCEPALTWRLHLFTLLSPSRLSLAYMLSKLCSRCFSRASVGDIMRSACEMLTAAGQIINTIRSSPANNTVKSAPAFQSYDSEAALRDFRNAVCAFHCVC